MVSRQIIEEILNMAVLAPSGENCQPWRFEVTGSRIRVFNLPQRDQSPYNFKQYGAFVAHGALLENMKVAASQFGVRCDIKLFPESETQEIVADVEFVEDGMIIKDPLYSFIATRVTNRKPYKKNPLTNVQQQALRHVAQSSGSAHTFLLSESPVVIAECAQAASVTEKILFAHPALHSFFFSHINWTYAQELHKRLGFYLKTLEVPPPAALLFRIWKYWPVMNMFNRILGINTFISKENAKVYSSAGAMGLVMSRGTTPADYVVCGMLTQRAWLTAASVGLFVQPLTGILFLINNVREGNAALFSKQQQEDIAAAYEIITKQFDVRDSRVVMMFRIGKGDAPSAKSVRLPADIRWK